MMKRRAFLRSLAAVGGVTFAGSRAVAAEPPPETARISLFQIPSICAAPTEVAEEFLRAEGFTDVKYVRLTRGGAWAPAGVESSRRVAAGEVDLSVNFSAPLILSLEAANPVVVLAGIHVGCLELVAREPLRTIRDLKGKRIAIYDFGSTPHLFLAAMLAHVGLDPAKDIEWVVKQPPNIHAGLFADGKIDAMTVFPPQAQELRARKIGHVVVATASDRPWSQYFCCLLEGNRDFVRKHPMATKRALRAMLKAASLCSAEPEKAARLLAEKRDNVRYEYALQAMKDLPYGQWRAYDPEDTLRFYALRLHEAGMIKSSPQKIIAQGTDWRFLNALKKEMKE